MYTPGRSLGLDVGDVRIGVALSDPRGVVALPLTVIESASQEQDVEAIRRIVEDTGVERIVAGLPLNQEGKPGPQAEKVLTFLDVLRAALDIEVIAQDERFTTALAERALIEDNVRRKRRKKVVDKIAAQQILQTYLDRQARTHRKP
ncbi:MAG TPA: Holliday junction resolvase RuvX [Candidatus Hydrogenedentes bacterium]|nr:Holliday junction resolvase RuvX [Candidatus Hydrogenedentota bacterium]